MRHIEKKLDSVFQYFGAEHNVNSLVMLKRVHDICNCISKLNLGFAFFDFKLVLSLYFLLTFLEKCSILMASNIFLLLSANEKN